MLILKQKPYLGRYHFERKIITYNDGHLWWTCLQLLRMRSPVCWGRGNLGIRMIIWKRTWLWISYWCIMERIKHCYLWKIWVTNLFTLSGSMNTPNAFKNLKSPKRIRKFYLLTQLLILWNSQRYSTRRSRPTTSQTYNYRLLRDLFCFLGNRQSKIKHKICFSKGLAVIEGKVT